jgi:hypothetical protein
MNRSDGRSGKGRICDPEVEYVGRLEVEIVSNS